VTILPIAPTIFIDEDKIPEDIPILGHSAIRFVEWSVPQYISDDSLSDFRPQIISDADGNLIAVVTPSVMI